MKVKITTAVLALGVLGLSADAEVLAGWYGAPGSPNAAASGITGNFSGGDGGRDNLSSNDGTYGASTPTGEASPGTVNAATAASGLITALRSGTSQATLTITNNTGNTVVLETLVWDMFVARSGANGADDFNLFSPGNLVTPLLNIDTENIESQDWMTDTEGDDVPYNMQDYSYDLGDINLADGQSWSIIFDEDDSAGPPIFIDNTAVLGYVVPEPTSLALLGLGGLLVVRRRKS